MCKNKHLKVFKAVFQQIFIVYSCRSLCTSHDIPESLKFVGDTIQENVFFLIEGACGGVSFILINAKQILILKLQSGWFKYWQNDWPMKCFLTFLS